MFDESWVKYSPSDGRSEFAWSILESSSTSWPHFLFFVFFFGFLLFFIKLLKPTGHVMHQQFNIQQLYVLPTLYLCVLYLSENKQRLVPLTA